MTPAERHASELRGALFVVFLLAGAALFVRSHEWRTFILGVIALCAVAPFVAEGYRPEPDEDAPYVDPQGGVHRRTGD